MKVDTSDVNRVPRRKTKEEVHEEQYTTVKMQLDEWAATPSVRNEIALEGLRAHLHVADPEELEKAVAAQEEQQRPTFFERALPYVKMGWYVLPVKFGYRPDGSVEKKPRLGKDWQHKTTNKEDVLASWDEQWPDDGVAVHLGLSNLISPDLDNSKDHETWAQLQADCNFSDEDALQQSTPFHEGGKHVFYTRLAKWKDVELKASINGLEIRRGDNYTVFSGEFDGKQYPPLEGTLQPAPDDLLERLRVPPVVEPEVDSKTTTGGIVDDAILELLGLYRTGELLREGRWKEVKDGTQQRYDTWSEAEFALVTMLSAWTRDPEQIDRIFRRTKMYDDAHRKKWERLAREEIEKVLASPYSGKRVYIPMSAEYLIANVTPTPPPLLPGYIPLLGVTGIVADSGVGKTALLFDVAIASIARQKCLGLDVAETDGWLFVDLENPEGYIRELLIRIKKTRGVAVLDRIHVLREVPYLLTDDKCIHWYTTYLKAFGLNQLVPDSMIKHLGGRDEDDNSFVAEVMERCRLIGIGANAGVKYQHHVPKSGANTKQQTARGAGAFRANADAMVMMMGIGEGKPRTLWSAKFRGRPGEEIKFHLNFEDDGFEAVVKSDAERDKDAALKRLSKGKSKEVVVHLKELLGDREPHWAHEARKAIQEKVDVSDNTIRNTLRDMEIAGWLAVESHNRGQPYRIGLTEEVA